MGKSRVCHDIRLSGLRPLYATVKCVYLRHAAATFNCTPKAILYGVSVSQEAYASSLLFQTLFSAISRPCQSPSRQVAMVVSPSIFITTAIPVLKDIFTSTWLPVQTRYALGVVSSICYLGTK
ncbi:hypothetical protein VFPPC_17509 [Pochonia chlamydosporia 170]|uniref:Uncharacterized protein n=1 Tax=Pochonia chlamydosporia 170 TaxID=1380566 RepID=A0A219ARB9_METCM|nr:hypothetical protein VFPPC_17509 [Pochonia chlamydosporia 170]OWT43328.1 hypothetical protein VFPPC_17509 [Pochonia chlamydosporia 170]